MSSMSSISSNNSATNTPEFPNEVITQFLGHMSHKQRHALARVSKIYEYLVKTFPVPRDSIGNIDRDDMRALDRLPTDFDMQNLGERLEIINSHGIKGLGSVFRGCMPSGISYFSWCNRIVSRACRDVDTIFQQDETLPTLEEPYKEERRKTVMRDLTYQYLIEAAQPNMTLMDILESSPFVCEKGGWDKDGYVFKQEDYRFIKAFEACLKKVTLSEERGVSICTQLNPQAAAKSSATLAAENNLTFANTAKVSNAEYKKFGPSFGKFFLQAKDSTNEFRDIILLEKASEDTFQPLSIDNISVRVGNQSADNNDLKSISLFCYLRDFRQYQSWGGNWELEGTLLRDGENSCLHQLQTGIISGNPEQQIPIRAVLRNSNQNLSNEALLVILVSGVGTSAQIIDFNHTHYLRKNEIELHVNLGGWRHRLEASRLEDRRKQKNSCNTGEMTRQETSHSELTVIQIPIIIEYNYPWMQSVNRGNDLDNQCLKTFETSPPLPRMVKKSNPIFALKDTKTPKKKAKTAKDEDAQLSIGSSSGNGFYYNYTNFKRDDKHPITAYTQKYSITNKDEIDSSLIQFVDNKLQS